eukprot:810147-Heterocapsa_arctica.AAC.1
MEGIMELIVYLENSLQMGTKEDNMEQEERENTSITGTEMNEAIKGIQQKMEQLETLRNKNDHMMEQLDRMMTIVTT